jgi:hypothetical protein
MSGTLAKHQKKLKNTCAAIVNIYKYQNKTLATYV